LEHSDEYNKALTHVVAKLGQGGSCAGADELFVRGLTADTTDKRQFVRDVVGVAHCNDTTKAYLSELLKKMSYRAVNYRGEDTHRAVAAICSGNPCLLEKSANDAHEFVESILRHIVM
jgi:hypothetical protein